MYTVRLQLDLCQSEECFLAKCFHFGNKIRNSIASVAQHRLNALFNDSEYRAARKEYGDSDFSKKKAKQLSASQKNVRSSFPLS